MEIGQPDMTQGDPNNAFTTVNITGTTTGVTTKEVPALCQTSNGVDVNNNPTYPALCEYTLSFPRYALSDGTSLYVADGGNDRVLIYNPSPTPTRRSQPGSGPDRFCDRCADRHCRYHGCAAFHGMGPQQ